jgi:alkylated DNA nucleotide flippase Atl1
MHHMLQKMGELSCATRVIPGVSVGTRKDLAAGLAGLGLPRWTSSATANGSRDSEVAQRRVLRPYGTMAKNKNTAKMTKCTMP